jgi:hypothetical protein
VTRTEAVQRARDEVFKRPVELVVYRLPAWPTGVYGVAAAVRGLPPTAQVTDTVGVPKTGSLFD